MAVGSVVNQRKMAKYCDLTIAAELFDFLRKEARHPAGAGGWGRVLLT
jgi:hypothetical protein